MSHIWSTRGERGTQRVVRGRFQSLWGIPEQTKSGVHGQGSGQPEIPASHLGTKASGMVLLWSFFLSTCHAANDSTSPVRADGGIVIEVPPRPSMVVGRDGISVLVGRERDLECPEQKPPNVLFGDLLLRIMYKKHSAQCLAR